MNPRPAERLVLAGLQTPRDDGSLFAEDMHEMRLLCATAGAEVSDIVIQRRESPVASTFLGPGKLEEIKRLMETHGATTLVIDATLSPGQIRTIEKLIGNRVIDRGQLILDIFAKHARTTEARVQVELAQLRMLSPRLINAQAGFSQQAGGIGTLGPGEKKLETDRRVVRRTIAVLEKRLEKIEKDRIEQRKSRQGAFKASLVGYTNVGKSTLLNALCGSTVTVENQLFATLDTATRRSYIPGTGELVISDTVGFLRKLPHHLVASFRSTLAVVAESHLLIWVMDASSSWIDQQYRTVSEVLNDLGAQTVPRLLVFNKADLVDEARREEILRDYPEALFVSAFSADDIRMLKKRIGESLRTFLRKRQKTMLIHRQSREAREK